ncbi:MAG: nucleotidyltransferase substrate binding protein [Rhodospirillales bacterium]
MNEAQIEKMLAEKPRWRHRFSIYSRAFYLLREAIEILEERELSQLEKEGVIQRFEYTWELAWNVLKDYLLHDGLTLTTITPATVIRAAHAAKIIEDAETWMRALDTRNKMSRTYIFETFEQTVKAIQAEYLAIFEALYEDMMVRAINEDSSV